MYRFIPLLALLLPIPAFSQGHGPVFGFATPTNSQGEFSFDSALMARGNGAASQLTARGIISYGITPFVQISVTAPGVLKNAALPPTRVFEGDDFEAKVAWRFHHKIVGVGKRFESTLFGSLVVPGPQVVPGSLADLKTAPGAMIAFASGIASRSHYFWVGGGYTAFAARDGDKLPNVANYSVVYAYRPRAWRTEPNKWDWRVLGELTGERSGRFQRVGFEIPGTASDEVFLGPSTLGVYKQYAIQGGVQFPVYRAVGPLLPRESYRVVLNFTYFLFPSHQH